MYTVKEVRTGKTAGKCWADLETEDGEFTKGVYIRRDDLKVGDTVEGEITSGQYGPMLKSNGSGGGSAQTATATAFGDKSQAEWHHQNALMFSCQVGGTDEEIITRAEQFEYWLAGGPKATLSPVQNGDAEGATPADDGIPF